MNSCSACSKGVFFDLKQEKEKPFRLVVCMWVLVGTEAERNKEKSSR